MITLKVPSVGELQLIADSGYKRFAECELKYIALNGEATHLYSDYLYIFVECMLKRINNICVIPEKPNHDDVISMGRWQEYCYFDSRFFHENEEYISLMEKSTFMSGDEYCLMLYSYKEITWLELNKCYKNNSMLPAKYYATPNNYQIFVAPISDETIKEWKHCLEPLHERVCL